MTRSQETHDSRTHGRPPGSFRGAPDGDKGRGGERANGRRQTGRTQKAGGAENKRREDRKGGERHTDGHAPGGAEEGIRGGGTEDSREGKQKKEYVIYLRERREGKRR